MANKNEVLGLVVSRFTDSDKQRQIYETKWDEVYKLYRFRIDQKIKGKANLFVPFAFSNVETVYPRLIAKRPRVRVLPIGPDDVEKANVMKNLIDYAWEKYSLDTVVKKWVKSSLIYGTGIIKVVWKSELKTRSYLETALNPDGSVASSTKTSKKEQTYDGPCAINLDIRDIFFDADATDISNCRWIIHRYRATKNELEANPNYKSREIGKVTYGFTNDQIRRGLHTSSNPTGSMNEAEVLEYWEDDRLVVIAGGVVLRDEPNPYHHKKKPFVVLHDQIDDQSIYGIGEIEPIEGLQNEMNTLRNMRMDVNTMSLNPAFIVRAGSVQDLDAIQLRPGYKIVVQGGADSIRPVEMPTPPATSYREEDSIKSDLQTVTGVSDYSRGTEATQMNQTATGISLIQDAANQRFNAKLQNVEAALQQMAGMIRDLYMQFAPESLILRITEKDGFSFKEITPEEIKGEFDILIEAGSTSPSNKMQERNEEMNKYNILSVNPLFQQSPKALLGVTRGLLDTWNDPAKDEILEALTEEVLKIEQEQEDQKMQAEARRQAELQVGGEMAGQNGAPQVPDEMTEGDEIPEEFKMMAAEQLEKAAGPMMAGEEIVEDLAEGLRE
jgi:hypothetical protein